MHCVVTNTKPVAMDSNSTSISILQSTQTTIRILHYLVGTSVHIRHRYPFRALKHKGAFSLGHTTQLRSINPKCNLSILIKDRHIWFRLV